MKILQINKYYYLKGGAETVFFNTIKVLENNGHTVIPFCLKNKKNLITKYDSWFVDYPELSESSLSSKVFNAFSFLYNRNSAENLEKLIKKEKPDIAHIHLLFNGISPSILPILKKYNIPIVMSVHDYRLICPAYTCRNGKGQICERCLETGNYWYCTLKKCSKGNLINSLLLTLEGFFKIHAIKVVSYIDHFIFVSKFSQEKHIKTIENLRSTVLYNSTPFINESLQITKGNYFLYFGRLSQEKGLDTLLNTFKLFPKIKLKIIGIGPLYEILKKKSPQNIELLGFKQGYELIDYIKNASFTIIPSEWYENNPLSVIESMALGKPVIGSNIGGIPELITNSVNGFLFKHNSVEDLARCVSSAIKIDESSYREMADNARNFAIQSFDQNKYYNKLIYIYNSLLENK